MKIVQLNASCGVGSTGKICKAISQLLTKNNVENYVLYVGQKNNYPQGIRYANAFYLRLQALKTRVFGNYGFNSKTATKKLIRILDRIQPDIIHIHNIHGHNVHLGLLFAYLKKSNIKTYWTFHDCWAFTAYCPHFDFVKCDQWKTECVSCVQYKTMSWFFDRSRYIYHKKSELLNSLQDLTIITPSQWLADLVKQSFLKNYPVHVIHNGIDVSVFKPTKSDFRERYHIPMDKFVLLGVAFGWEKRKGLDVFVELSRRLDPEKYQIVLVGTDDAVDKTLPENIISIHRTQNQQELAEIYTAADLFVNPTREENYPTVNMEAIACGTPVITFRTGGSPEILDETCGSVVDCDDIAAMEREIRRICENAPYSIEDCLLRAQSFDQQRRFKEYIEFYEKG